MIVIITLNLWNINCYWNITIVIYNKQLENPTFNYTYNEINKYYN